MEEKLKYFNVDRNSFNPWDYVQDDNNGKFLPLPAKKAWFRTRYPEGNIRYNVVTEADGYIVVEAMVYADRKDSGSEYLGFGTSFATFDQVYAESFRTDLERHLGMRTLAYGKAAARALTDAGFGLQFYIDEPDPESISSKPCDTQEATDTSKVVVRDAEITEDHTVDFMASTEEVQQTTVTAIPKIAKIRHTKALTVEAPQDSSSQEQGISDFPSAVKRSLPETVTQSVDLPSKDNETCEFDRIPSMEYNEALKVKVDCGTLADRSNPELSKSVGDIINSTQMSKLSYVFVKTKSEKVKSAIKTVVENDPNMMKYFFSKGIVTHQ